MALLQAPIHSPSSQEKHHHFQCSPKLKPHRSQPIPPEACHPDSTGALDHSCSAYGSICMSALYLDSQAQSGLYLRRDWRKMHRYKSEAAFWRRYSLGRHKKNDPALLNLWAFPIPALRDADVLCLRMPREESAVPGQRAPAATELKHHQLLPKMFVTLRVRKCKWKLSHATDIPSQWVRGTPSHVISCYKKQAMHTRMWG